MNHLDDYNIEKLLEAFGGVMHLKNVNLNDSKLKLDSLYAYEQDLTSKLKSCREEISKAQENYFEHVSNVNMWVQAYEKRIMEVLESLKAS